MAKAVFTVAKGFCDGVAKGMGPLQFVGWQKLFVTANYCREVFATGS